MEHLQRELTRVCRGAEQKVIGPLLPILSDLFLNITELLLAKYLLWYIYELPPQGDVFFRKHNSECQQNVVKPKIYIFLNRDELEYSL